VGYIEQQDKRRSDFLVAVFEATNGGSSAEVVALSDIATKLGITLEEAVDVFDYLRGRGLVELRFVGGEIRLTVDGRTAVENALRQPPPRNPVGFRP